MLKLFTTFILWLICILCYYNLKSYFIYSIFVIADTQIIAWHMAYNGEYSMFTEENYVLGILSVMSFICPLIPFTVAHFYGA